MFVRLQYFRPQRRHFYYMAQGHIRANNAHNLNSILNDNSCNSKAWKCIKLLAPSKLRDRRGLLKISEYHWFYLISNDYWISSTCHTWSRLICVPHRQLTIESTMSKSDSFWKEESRRFFFSTIQGGDSGIGYTKIFWRCSEDRIFNENSIASFRIPHWKRWACREQGTEPSGKCRIALLQNIFKFDANPLSPFPLLVPSSTPATTTTQHLRYPQRRRTTTRIPFQRDESSLDVPRAWIPHSYDVIRATKLSQLKSSLSLPSFFVILL